MWVFSMITIGTRMGWRNIDKIQVTCMLPLTGKNNIVGLNEHRAQRHNLVRYNNSQKLRPEYGYALKKVEI